MNSINVATTATNDAQLEADAVHVHTAASGQTSSPSENEDRSEDNAEVSLTLNY